MLKTSNTKSVESKKGGVRVGGDSKARHDGSEINESAMNNIKVDGDKVGCDEVEKKVRKMSKSKNLSKSKKRVELDFLTPGARLAYIKLRQAFIKALIFYHFDLEYPIQIETDVSGYTIDGVLSQLTSDNSGRWHPLAFFSHKIIPAEIKYKTHDNELLAIVEAFKM